MRDEAEWNASLAFLVLWVRAIAVQKPKQLPKGGEPERKEERGGPGEPGVEGEDWRRVE